MKVISGSLKGRNLKWAKETRPLSQRAKTSLFDILNPYIKDSKVLDLFAGSGGLGIEALSRGAKYAIFVEISPYATEKITENLRHTDLQNRGEVHQMPSDKYVKRLLNQDNPEDKFDIIFIFPPYDVTNNSEIGKVSMLLNDNGLLIAEHHKKFKIKHDFENLSFIETRTYGITSISFFQAKKSIQE